MSRARLSDQVRLRTGEVVTVGSLLDDGRGRLETAVSTYKRNGDRHERTAYLIVLDDGAAVEIGKTAWLSRKGLLCSRCLDRGCDFCRASVD